MQTPVHALGHERASKRTRVLLTATIMAPNGAHKVRIRDISAVGAQVCGQGLQVDCDALFKRGQLFAAARIIWSANNEAGLRFYRTLRPEELNLTL